MNERNETLNPEYFITPDDFETCKGFDTVSEAHSAAQFLLRAGYQDVRLYDDPQGRHFVVAKRYPNTSHRLFDNMLDVAQQLAFKVTSLQLDRGDMERQIFDWIALTRNGFLEELDASGNRLIEKLRNGRN